MESLVLNYKVSTTQGIYYFSVVSNQYGDVSVSEVKRGQSVQSERLYPSKIHTEITSAISRANNIMANVSVLSGTVVLDDANTGVVNFTIPVSDASYRVLFTLGDFIAVRTTAQTTTSFNFELGQNFTGNLNWELIF